MSRPRLVRAVVLIGAALVLGAAPPPEEVPRPSTWSRFVNGAKHALFDRENPRTTGKQPPAREKTAKTELRGQAPPRAGSVSGPAKFQRTLPRDSDVRPASAVASDKEPSDSPREIPAATTAEQTLDEPADAQSVDTLPPVARTARVPSRGAVRPPQAAQPKSPAGKNQGGNSSKRGQPKPRSVSEYMAQERP